MTVVLRVIASLIFAASFATLTEASADEVLSSDDLIQKLDPNSPLNLTFRGLSRTDAKPPSVDLDIRFAFDSDDLLPEARAQLALARVLLRREGTRAAAAIRRALDRGEALLAETGAKNLQPFIHLERAELARLENDPRTRERELRTALGLFDEMEAPIRVREVEALLADSR